MIIFFWEGGVLEILIMDYNPQNSNQSSNLIRKNKKKSGQFPTVLLSYIYIYIKCKTLKLTQDDTHSYLLP